VPAPTPPVEVIPTPPPTYEAETYSPTFGSTPVSIIVQQNVMCPDVSILAVIF
jgi:hypothetical protein